jgi:hypothetical protein
MRLKMVVCGRNMERFILFDLNKLFVALTVGVLNLSVLLLDFISGT